MTTSAGVCFFNDDMGRFDCSCVILNWMIFSYMQPAYSIPCGLAPTSFNTMVFILICFTISFIVLYSQESILWIAVGK